MKLSTERILTTHVGSLPRSQQIFEMVFAQERGELMDEPAFKTAITSAVREVVRKQAAAGVDIVSDGEMSKISYATYIKYRLSGFEGDSPRRTPADLEAYPNFAGRASKSGGTPSYQRPRCAAPVAFVNRQPLEEDIANFKAALAGAGVTEGFMNSASPGVIALFQPNDYYPTHTAYLEALGEAMRLEYEAICGAGLVLQVDSPDLALGRHMMFKDLSEQDFLKMVEEHIEVLNHALRNIPAEQVRLHACWGNYEGPHHCDIELKKILPALLKAKPQVLSFEASNPRHAHEWQVFKDLKLPDDKVIMPGMLDSTTNFVEHPELVAERIVRYAGLVGKERVLAGTDCGFSTFAGFGTVDKDIVYAKLESLAKGAELASARLW